PQIALSDSSIVDATLDCPRFRRLGWPADSALFDTLLLAIVSDIHGNMTALEAVVRDIERRAVDRVLQGGDLALAGCQPAEVIDCVRELGWEGIVGNTDELLWRPEERAVQERNAPKLRDLLRLLFEDYAPVTRELIGEERIA